MQKMGEKTPRNRAIRRISRTEKPVPSSERISLQLFDEMVTNFTKRVLWWETSAIRMDRESREDIADCIAAFLQISRDALEIGLIPLEFTIMVRNLTSEIARMEAEIAKYNREKAEMVPEGDETTSDDELGS
jgi:hypothetical protein